MNCTKKLKTHVLPVIGHLENKDKNKPESKSPRMTEAARINQQMAEDFGLVTVAFSPALSPTSASTQPALKEKKV